MKNKSTYAPQWELPGTEIVFNLRGEVQTMTPPRPQPREDKTPEMWSFPATSLATANKAWLYNFDK